MRKDINEDDLIRLAMLGAFLTTYAAARGAAEVLDGISDFVEDPVGGGTKKVLKAGVAVYKKTPIGFAADKAGIFDALGV